MPIMRDNTPYHLRPSGEIAREVKCMNEIFAQATPVKTVWEAFGGIGSTARVLSEKFQQAYIRACDLDPGCVMMYNSQAAQLYPMAAEGEFAQMEPLSANSME